MALQLNGTDGVTFNDGSNQPAAASPIGTKNLIINGNMQIAQRGTSYAGVTNNTYHTVDRWKNYISLAGTFTMSQDTDAPEGFSNSIKWQCTATGGTDPDAYFHSSHQIEGQNLQHLKYGTANAETLTCSFWIKSNKTGTYVVIFNAADSGKQIIKTYTIDAADTWEKKTITFIGNTADSIVNDEGTGLAIWHWFVAGSNRKTGGQATGWASRDLTNEVTDLTVNLADSTSNYINITGVQLEVGDTATPFEHVPYDMNLARCQRYYEETDPDGRVSLGGYIKQTNTRGRIFWSWKVKKRTAPVLEVAQDTAGLALTLQYGDSGSRNCSNTQITMSLPTLDCCQLDIQLSETMLSGYGLTAHVRGDLSGNTRLTADAEL